MEPPNRSSLWRFPEFAKENPPINYDDNRLYCGGFAVSHMAATHKLIESTEIESLPIYFINVYSLDAPSI